jgi:predicted ATPase
MKESLIIRNVGPLQDIYIEEIKPFTVLIGESASGKSTMMKVVVLMRYLYKMLNIRWFLKNAGINMSPFRLKIDNLLFSVALIQNLYQTMKIYLPLYSIKLTA